MNPARVAQLLRELADEFDGAADDAPALPPPPKSEPRRTRKTRTPRMPTRPEGTAPPSVSAQAERILRGRGMR
jgi:hypothetical protein